MVFKLGDTVNLLCTLVWSKTWDPPASAFQVVASIGDCHHIWLLYFFLLKAYVISKPTITLKKRGKRLLQWLKRIYYGIINKVSFHLMKERAKKEEKQNKTKQKPHTKQTTHTVG